MRKRQTFCGHFSPFCNFLNTNQYCRSRLLKTRMNIAITLWILLELVLCKGFDMENIQGLCSAILTVSRDGTLSDDPMGLLGYTHQRWFLLFDCAYFAIHFNHAMYSISELYIF